MGVGWVLHDKHWYYAESSGALAHGWKKSGSAWYYLDHQQEDRMLANTTRRIDGILYAFKSGGAMVAAKGWVQLPGGWVYGEGSSGKLRTGWLEEKGSRYYLDTDTGYMLTGAAVIDGEEHQFSSGGALIP